MSPEVSAFPSLARNVLALIVVQVANLMLPLFTLPYLLRVLGLEQFGVYGFCQGVLAYAVLLVDYGFQLSATQRIAQVKGQPDQINRIFWAVQAAKAVLLVAALAVLALLVWQVPAFRAVWPVMLASTPAVLGSLLFPQWFFLGLERMGSLVMYTVVASVIAIVLMSYMVHSPQDVWRAALIQASVPVMMGIMTCAWLWRQKLLRWVRPTWHEMVYSLRDSWHLFTATAAISLYTQSNVVLLGLLSNPSAVGVFTAADKIRQAVQALVIPLSQAAYPRGSALMAHNRQAGLTWVRQLLWLQGGLSLVLSCALWVLAPYAVWLVMGTTSSAVVDVLQLLAPLPFLVGLSNVLGVQTMLPLGLKKQLSYTVLVSGGVNLLLLLLLAPRWQANGAAVAVLCTELLVTLSLGWLLRRQGVFFFKAT